MKKTEIIQLTKIIEHIVAKEVRKQLPGIISETFKNMMGKSIVSENRSTQQQQPLSEPTSDFDEELDVKASLKELFSKSPPVSHIEQVPQSQQRQFTKNPILNQILNETTGDLRNRERLVGAAAFQGGYSPGLNMIPGFNPNAANVQMESGPEPDFLKKMPPIQPIQPRHAPVLQEGQESMHAPLSEVPQGISALDVATQVAAPEVRNALTRNYSQMLKLIDKKRGKI